MKVSIIANNLAGKGGIESVLVDLINNDKKNDYSLFVFNIEHDRSWLNQFNITKKNIKYTGIENKGTKIKKAIDLTLFIRKQSPDVVLVLGTKQLSFVYLIRKLLHLKFKIVFWPHFSLKHFYLDDEPAIEKNSVTKADYYFAISTGIKKEFIELGISANKIFLIYNPINRQERVITDVNSTTNFVMISRVMYKGQKNVSELLKACALLKGSWQLSIIGDTSIENGTELKKCLSLCKNLNIENQVDFKGWFSDPWKQITNASCLIMSSTYEGFGLVLCEALSRGLPVISSDCPDGPDDIIQNGVNGYLYNMGDYKKLAQEMQLFIDKKTNFNPEKEKKSINKFYLENYINNLQNVLEHISEKGGK